MNSDSVKQKSTRKVAILIQLVNEELADFLLGKMSLEEAAAVRQMTEQLEPIHSDEQEEVIQEFLQQTGWAREDVLGASESVGEDVGGVELQWSASVKTGADAPTQEFPRHEHQLQEPQPWKVPEENSRPEFEASQVGLSPLSFVGQDSAPMMVKMIRNESGAMGAVILSLLEPGVAARVLEHFDESARLQLLQLLSELGETHPEVIAEIVTQVRQELESVHRPVMTAGMQAVQRILDTSGWSSDSQVWDQLGKNRVDQVNGNVPIAFETSSPVRPPDSSFAEANGSQVIGPAKLFKSSESSPRVDETMGHDEAGFRSETLKIAPETSVFRETDSARAKRSAHTAENRFSTGSGERREEDVLAHSRRIQSQFDTLVDWPAKTLIQIFKSVPPKVMRMAMTGARSELMAKMKKVLSRQQASRLERDIERSGPIRLADIHKAQEAVLGVIEELQEQGKVDIPERLAVEA